MGNAKKSTRKKDPKTPLQALFIRRVQEELDQRGWTRNVLGLKSKALGGAPQRTVNDVMNGSDPRLETVYYLAAALGVHAWELLKNGSVSAKGSNVQDFPTAPKMLAKGSASQAKTASEIQNLRRDTPKRRR